MKKNKEIKPETVEKLGGMALSRMRASLVSLAEHLAKLDKKDLSDVHYLAMKVCTDYAMVMMVGALSADQKKAKEK